MSKKAPPPEPPIEQYRFGRLSAKKSLPVAWHEIRPAIRLARPHAGTLNFRARIIFDYLLFYVQDGGATWHIRGKDVEIGKRHLMIIPPFEPHYSVTGEDRSCDHIAIHFDWRPQFPSNRTGDLRRTPYRIVLPEGLSLPTFQVLTPYDVVPGLIDKITALWQAGSSLSRLHADALLFELLATLLKRTKSQPGEPATRHAVADRARIEASIAGMERELSRPLNVSKLAEISGLSPSRYSHLFRQVTGRSPMEYLASLRILRAKELLEDFRLSIKEVAARCGFDDPYYFSKVFSRQDGMPPSQYRETLLRVARS